MNPTSSRSRSKLYFFHYIKPYMIHFQNTQESHGKIQDSLENSKSKGSFSQNTLKSILFDWNLFWRQSF